MIILTLQEKHFLGHFNFFVQKIHSFYFTTCKDI